MNILMDNTDSLTKLLLLEKSRIAMMMHVESTHTSVGDLSILDSPSLSVTVTCKVRASH